VAAETNGKRKLVDYIGRRQGVWADRTTEREDGMELAPSLNHPLTPPLPLPSLLSHR